MNPLTFAFHRDYAFLAAGVPVAGVRSPKIRRAAALSGIFYARYSCPPVYGLQVERAERLAGSLSPSSNLHFAAHPHLEVRRCLIRSFTMKRTSKGASAPKFAVISDLPGCTIYTGTREQLIALGFARPDQFPEGRKRLKWDYSMANSIEEGWAIRKIKGGTFELKKSHKNRGAVTKTDAWLKVPLEPNAAGYFNWKLFGDDIDGLQNGRSYSSLAEAARLIAETVEYEQYQSRINRLSLVKPVTATGGGQ